MIKDDNIIILIILGYLLMASIEVMIIGIGHYLQLEIDTILSLAVSIPLFFTICYFVSLFWWCFKR